MKKLLSLTAFVLCISLATTVYPGGYHGGRGYYGGHGGGYYCSGNGWNDGWAVAAAVLGTAIVLNAIMLYTCSCCCSCWTLGNPTGLGTRNKPAILG